MLNYLNCACRLVVMCLCLCVWFTAAQAGEIVYLNFDEAANFPASPSSMLLKATSLDVPAGASLKVHLLRGEQLVATSLLKFSSAFQYSNPGPGLPVAEFYPSVVGESQFLPNVLLSPGTADLDAVATAPQQFRLLWELSDGIIGRSNFVLITPAVFTPPIPFVELKVTGHGAGASLNDQKPGSLLLFHRYSSNASNSQREDTQITLTNAHPAINAYVRMFLVAGSSCQVNELQLCLAPQQSTNFLMSDLDPGTRGYLMAVATDATGKPVQFNWLTGNAIIKNNGQSLSLNAYAVSKRDGAVVTPGADNLAELVFDDSNYDRLPSQLAFEGVPSQANGANATTMTLYRPLANFATGSMSVTAQLTGRSTSAPATPTVGSVSVACYSDTPVSNLRLSPVTSANLLPSGTSAWFIGSVADGKPLLGVQLNAGAFNGGFSARPLAYATEYRIKIPLAAVSCQ
jgi:hypothetical protein